MVPTPSDAARALPPVRPGRAAPSLVLAATLLAAGGCSSSVRVTDPPRSATEQFLLSGAATKAVNQLAVEDLRGRKVFVDTDYFASSEQPFVIGELRARLLLSGVELVPTRDDAEIIMEIRSSGVGVDRSDFLVGVPSILIRAGSDDDDSETTIPLATPELALVKNIKQLGVASVAFVAYWKDSGDVVAASGPALGFSRRQDWWFLGIGRRIVGDIPPTEPPE